MQRQLVTLIVEGVEVEAKVRVRSRRDLKAKKLDRREAAKVAREEREYA